MTINVHLDPQGLKSAIRKLEDLKDGLERGTAEFVDIMCLDGADVANEAYGGMATAWGHREESYQEGVEQGYIGVGAETEDAAIIAEFGAGYATMSFHPWAKKFEQKTGIPIEPVSYSHKHFGLLWAIDLDNPGHGYWYWGSILGGSMGLGVTRWKSAFGVKMDRVQPRHGLLNARDHIYNYGTETAQRVIKEMMRL